MGAEQYGTLPGALKQSLQAGTWYMHTSISAHASPALSAPASPLPPLPPLQVDKARREEIIALASKFMYPSGLAYRPGEQVEAEQQVRGGGGCSAVLL